ncbi:MAG TPA: hypothetical protein VFL83_18860 [Anaeromyxobacter sp.]|nr:hypothetical protein [Anaeromyxobacter sp.]
MSALARAATVVALAFAAGCGRKEAAPAGLGRPAFQGPVRALSASPDGAWLAFLDGCAEVKGQALPPQTASCDLRVVAAAPGGAARRLASAVTTLPHALAWTPAGGLVALASYEVPTASGALVAWEGGEPRTLAAGGVTFHGVGPRGEVAWVEGGRLRVLVPGEPAPRDVAGADAVASFDLAPGDACGAGAAGVRLFARRVYAAGGQLLAAGCDLREARPFEKGQVGEYGFAPSDAAFAYTVQGRDGAELKLVLAGAPPATVGRGAQAFAFAPDGKTLAFVADVVPGKQGNLYLATPGRPAKRVAREVGELRWAARAPRVAWLERYDPRVRAGALGAGGPGLAPRTLAPNVSDLEISPDGEHLAFLQHTTRGGYSVDLALAHLSSPPDAKPVAVAQGVFGFAFSPDGAWLYYRTRCIRNAEACDLERVPATGLPSGAAPERIAEGVKSFEFDPRDPGRLLVTWQRKDMVALDVAVWERGGLTSVDTAVLPGSARFLGPDSRRVAYVVAHPKRQGVYVAELPR